MILVLPLLQTNFFSRNVYYHYNKLISCSFNQKFKSLQGCVVIYFYAFLDVVFTNRFNKAGSVFRDYSKRQIDD